MAKYSYVAINEAGQKIAGEVEASSESGARNVVSGMGYIPLDVKEGMGSGGEGVIEKINYRLARVKTADLILFTKQLRTMLAAGLSVIDLLNVLQQQTENLKLKRICAVVADDVKKGLSISDALAKHGKVFSSLYISMVRAGEMAGALPEVLERLIYIIEHEHKVKSDIKSALQYPITVVIALVGAFFFLLTYVIPTFAKIFKSAKITLPLPTQIAMTMNFYLTEYWYLFLGGLLGLIVFLRLWFKTDGGKLARDAFFLRLPIIGVLFIKAAMSRFASIFAILQASGVQVLQTLDILAGTIGNFAIAKEFERIKDLVREGRGIAKPLERAKYFTPMVVSMVAVGEETGNLDEMLRAVSEHYDYEVSYAVKGLSDALGPVLIVGLAGVVGFFALAIFMPMWDLTQMVK
jgi:type II secretory pathway component PulF